MHAEKKVAIVGAGFTGLTAAYELVKNGVDVTIYEGGNDIGGLAGGFTALPLHVLELGLIASGLGQRTARLATQ